MKKFILKTGSILISLLLISCAESEKEVKPAPEGVSISITTSTPSIAAGGEIALAGNIQNNGDTAINGANLVFYTSTNANINIISGVSIDNIPIPSIAAGSSSDFSKEITGHNTIGTMYYGVCLVDISGDGAEYTETAYNCSSGVAIEVIPVDLAVATLSATPAQIGVGGSINFSGSIQNQGATASTLANLIFYRSSDAEISPSDTSIDNIALPSIAAGSSSDFSKGVTGHNTIGTMYYGACLVNVRGESATNNNCSNGIAIEVIPVDLVVATLSATPTRIRVGDSINFSGSIQNQGATASTLANLIFYRSSDAEISPSDTSIDNIALPSIAAGSSSDFSKGVTGNTIGTMYYGVCLVNVSGESATNNNCSNGVAIEVIPVDLNITTFDANPKRIFSGGSINFSGIIRNEGEATSTTATLNIYRSNSATISPSDTPAESIAVTTSIAVDSSYNFSGNVGGHNVGTAYYGACLVDVRGETNTSNNCSLGIAVEIIPVSLFVATFDANPKRIFSGDSVNLSGYIQNDGGIASTNATLELYRSSDSAISTSDTSLFRDTNFSIGAGATSDIARSVTGHNSGTAYYGVCVVADSGETSCSSGVAIEVIPPDLVVATVDANPIRILSGASFTLRGKVQNNGSTSPAATLNIYRSLDSVISPSDNVLEDISIPSITTDSSIDFSGSVTGHSAGTFYYGACLINVSGEGITNNNCSLGIAVEVIPVDLLVGTFDANPLQIPSGGNITLTANVRNDGETTSTNATFQFYRSLDNVISTSDNLLGEGPIASIAAGATHDIARSVTGHNAGTMYYGACLINVSGEVNTNNNCSNAVAVEVQLVDLLVATIDANPMRILSGASFTLTANVRNDGDIFSRSANLIFYRSVNSIISTSDNVLGNISISSVTADASLDFARSFTGHSAGTMYYGACVLDVIGEVVTENNCSNALAVEVIPVDLVITAITTTSADAIAAGDTFNLSATVQNNGEAPSTGNYD